MAEGWREADVKAQLNNATFDRDGNLVLTFMVEPQHKYDVLPITDIKGRAFLLHIECASRRVFAGKEGVAEAKERVKARAAARDEFGRKTDDAA